MRYAMYNILSWIDNHINHTIVDGIWNMIPCNNVTHWIWEHTSYAFCYWVKVKIGEPYWDKED